MESDGFARTHATQTQALSESTSWSGGWSDDEPPTSDLKGIEKEVIGINVSAKTIKNKVSPPFRTVNFEIHFGKGIREHEQVFDVLRKHGPETIDGNEICVSGTGAWKSLTVVGTASGKKIVEKKFYKADFEDVWKDPQYKQFIDDLLERAMVRVMEGDEHVNIDPESYEEVRSLAGMNIEIVDPEE